MPSQSTGTQFRSSRKLFSTHTFLLLGLLLLIVAYVPQPVGADTNCTPPVDFLLDTLPDHFILIPSATASSTITITPRNGFAGTVGLTADNVPPEITSPSFSSPSVDLSTGTKASTLTFHTSSTITPGSYGFDVSGTSGSLKITASITVTVPGPEIGISTDKLFMTLTQGTQDTATITVDSLYGFFGVVTLTTSVTPVSAPTPPTANISPTSISLAASAQGTSTLTVSTDASATLGFYEVKITGTNVDIVNSTSIYVQVQGPDFSIEAKPLSLTVPAGSTRTATLEVNSTMGFIGAVSLTTDVTAFLGTPPIVTLGTYTLPLGADQKLTTSITVDATTATPGIVPYLATITGTSGSTAHSALLSIAVPTPENGFSLTSDPASLTIDRGGVSKTSQITVKSNNLDDTVDLSISCSEEITATISPGSVSITTGNSAAATLTLSASQYTTPGTYEVTVGGSGKNSLALNFTSVEITVVGPDFSLNSSPTSLNIQQGSSATSTISYTGLNTFSETVNLATTVVGPSGITAVLSSPTITSSTTSTLTVSVSGSVAPGPYGVGVIGTSGSLSHILPVIVTVTAQSPDFTVSASPNTLGMTFGTQTTSTITIDPLNGFNSDVALSATIDQASGLTVSFDPNTITSGSGSSTATFAASSTGFYAVTITASGGGVTKTTTVQVTVSAAPDFTMSATPTTLSFTQGTTATSTISFTSIAGFNGGIALVASSTAGLTVSFNPPTTSYNTPSTATFDSNTPGSYTVTITGTSGSISHSATVQVIVTETGTPDFTINPNVSSLTITAGSSKTATVTIAPTNGFYSTVTLTSVQPSSGLTVTFDPNSIVYGSGSSTVTINVGSSTAAGTYTVTITGTNGNLSHSTSITVTVQSPAQTSSNPSSGQILGLDANVFYVLAGGIVALLVVGVGVVAVRMRKPKSNSNNGVDSDWASR